MIHDEPCRLCGKDIEDEAPVIDMFEEPHHAACYENAQQSASELAYERELSGDFGGSAGHIAERQARIQRELK